MSEMGNIELVIKLGAGPVGEGATLCSGKQEFSVVIQRTTKQMLMGAIKKIVDDGKEPSLQIGLRYGYGGSTVVESAMTPVYYTESPAMYPLHPA